MATPLQPLVRRLCVRLSASALAAALLACASDARDGPVGYKIGFTSPSAQARFGIDSPVWGRLLASMQVAPGGGVPASSFSRVFVEAEIAFVIGRRLDRRLEEPAELVAHVASVHPALELPDWRFGEEERPGVAEIVADGVGAHRFVLGAGRAPGGVDLAGARVLLERDGREIGRGRGADALGDPWAALLWLSRSLVARGGALEAGEIVLTGALGPVYLRAPEAAAGRYRVTVEGLGRTEVTITP